MSYDMSSVQVRGGKGYTEVKERIKKLRVDFPGYDLHGEIVRVTDADIIIKYSVTSGTQSSGDYRVHATGFAHERMTSSGVNSTSHVENCDTSAMGRALGCFGIGVDTAFGSADEYKHAIDQQSSSPAAPATTAAPVQNTSPNSEIKKPYRGPSEIKKPYRGPYEPKM